jgi:ABC-type uncharacterized transport system substrate-binding protein
LGGSAIGLQIQVVNASTVAEINAAFAALAHERADALFVGGDAFFTGRRVQLATLAARDRIPASYSGRDYVAAGGLMSYGTDLADAWRQVGVYTGNILQGRQARRPAGPAGSPVRVRHQSRNSEDQQHRPGAAKRQTAAPAGYR